MAASSTTETISVSREDLVELIVHARAACEVAVFFNGTMGPVPGWEDFDVAWLLRERYLMPDFDPDSGGELHEPVFLETEARADEIAAAVLEGMLNDEDETLGLSGLFNDDVHQIDWLPVATVRRQMRKEIKRLRERGVGDVA